jgi:hypothetical protein
MTDTTKQPADILTKEEPAAPASVAPEPKAAKVAGEKYTVETIIDLNNVRLRMKDGNAFFATVKDSGDLKVGDKVEIKSQGSADGVPYGAAVS